MARDIIRVSMNEDEKDSFMFFKQRLSIVEDSKAIKNAVELAHYFIDQMQKSVPHEVFLQYLTRLKFEKKLYEQSFEDWRKARAAMKGIDLKDM